MSTNTAEDIRTLAYVLKRTNFGEADRILNLLTPSGKVSAMARGVRKEKSKLASSVEMFCLVDVNLHAGKSELYTLTSAKLLKFSSNLITDLSRLVDQALAALNDGQNQSLVEAWFWLNFAKASGEEINLYRDTDDQKLSEDVNYIWDVFLSALKPQPGGEIGANEIKLMRLMLASKLDLVSRVRNIEPSLGPISYIAKALNKL